MIEIKKEQSEQDFYISKLIEKGSEITGRFGAGLIGGLAGGVPGMLAGAAYGSIMGELLKNAGLQVKKWAMGDRQEIRVGATYAFGAKRIEEILKEGGTIRDDDFLKDSETNRSTAAEILEGTLLSAQDEYEELKLKHYGFFIANLSFRKEINRGFANFLLRLIQRLSYRQLCLLEILDNENHKLYKSLNPPQKEKVNLSNPFSLIHSSLENLGPFSVTKKELYPHLNLGISFDSTPVDITYELKELFQQELISDTTKDKKPYQIKLTRLGESVRDLLQLGEINKKDLIPLVEMMTYAQTEEEYNGGFQFLNK